VFYNGSGKGANAAGAMCFIMYMMWYADFESIWASFQSKGFEPDSGGAEMDFKLFVFTFGKFCRTQHTESFLEQPESAWTSVLQDNHYV
jgi:hypothetical protein